MRRQIRNECEVDGSDVTIVERRPPWGRLYSPGSDEHRHAYPDLPVARTVGELLDEIDRDPTALFWG